MAEPRKNDGWLIVLYALLLIAGLSLLAFGVIQYLHGADNGTLLALGVLAVAVPAALYPVAARPGAAETTGAPPPASNADETVKLLKSINDRLLVSDGGKRIAYRQQD